MVTGNRVPLTEALKEDFGSRSATETEIADVVASVHSLRYARRHLPLWALPRLRGTSIWFLPGTNRVVAQPKGVVGIISPWNYPLALTAMDVLPALVAGNAVVQKPDNQTALSALWLAELAEEAGLPAGVWQIVLGRGSVIGPALIEESDYLCFTGSTPTGNSSSGSAPRPSSVPEVSTASGPSDA